MSEFQGPNIDTVRGLIQKVSNWGRWGVDDQVGTLNLIDAAAVTRGRDSIRRGEVISLALPFDDSGPQTGARGRFNPIHLMIRDGADAIAGTAVEDFYGGVDRHIRATDDIVIMPLQAGTQWDALAHVIFEDSIFNGHSAATVSSRGAAVGDVVQFRNRLVGRSFLIDLPRYEGVSWLEGGRVIESVDLELCLKAQGCVVESGDVLLIRTGAIARRRHEGQWGDYAGGPAAGLGLSTVEWLHDREVAAVATDTWAAEVLPNETSDVFQPLHILLIWAMGMPIGEIFDLEELGEACAADGVYESFFVGSPLPFSRAVGAPVNPIVVR